MGAQIHFHPTIIITAEQAASVLGISLEKAAQVLSRPDTKEILRQALNDSAQATLLATLQKLARIPHEIVPERADCTVALAASPAIQPKAEL